MGSSLNHSLSAKQLIVWQLLQGLGIMMTVLLLIGFFIYPNLSLNVLWNVLIPILPATFLITPALWRAVCPLATLNMSLKGMRSRKHLSVKILPRVGATGIVLLMLLVPARRFLFNEHGMSLAFVIVAVAIAAVVLGGIFEFKAGFCNAICPVLPVEKLYGQYPLLKLGNPRCKQCNLCTPKGCLDLAPSKSATQATGTGRNTHTWLKSAYGIFAAGFPGFVVGYFMTENTSLENAGGIYLTILLWALGSYALVAFLVFVLKVRVQFALPVLAGITVGLYYWYAAPGIAANMGNEQAGIIGIRSLSLLLAGGWLWRAMGKVR